MDSDVRLLGLAGNVTSESLRDGLDLRGGISAACWAVDFALFGTTLLAALVAIAARSLREPLWLACFRQTPGGRLFTPNALVLASLSAALCCVFGIVSLALLEVGVGDHVVASNVASAFMLFFVWLTPWVFACGIAGWLVESRGRTTRLGLAAFHAFAFVPVLLVGAAVGVCIGRLGGRERTAYELAAAVDLPGADVDALVAQWLDAGADMSVSWRRLAYILTAAMTFGAVVFCSLAVVYIRALRAELRHAAVLAEVLVEQPARPLAATRIDLAALIFLSVDLATMALFLLGVSAWFAAYDSDTREKDVFERWQCLLWSAFPVFSTPAQCLLALRACLDLRWHRRAAERPPFVLPVDQVGAVIHDPALHVTLGHCKTGSSASDASIDGARHSTSEVDARDVLKRGRA